MIELNIPKFSHVRLEHLVLDSNGTISLDGKLISGVADRIEMLRKDLKVYVVTSDTFGSAQQELEDLCPLKILSSNDHRSEKMTFVQALSPKSVVAIGNGQMMWVC